MIGTGIGIGRHRRTSGGGAPAVVSGMIFGQSELEYLLNTGAAYRQITQPTPGNGNLIVFTQDGAGVPPVRTVVNAATVAAGQVNPTMAAWSALFAYVRPGVQFVVGDGAVAGTSRYELVDDTESSRLWTDLTSVLDAIEAEFGSIRAWIECWYNADAASIGNFRDSFWPLYFGSTGAGAGFTLGTTNPAATNTTARFDHCLWDHAAAPGAKGRGVLTKAATNWHILTPMPFMDAPVSPTAEMANFSENGARMIEPARASMIALADDLLAQSVSLRVGPSAHLCNFGGNIHPVTNNRDGQILLGWPLAIAMLRESEMTINEPTISVVTCPTDGAYADVEVLLPNGGTLTTLRAFRAAAAPGVEPPHYQPVVGFEVTRAGSGRRPLFKTSETSYPIAHRGTLAITDSGSGMPRRGVVRITPTNPFAFGESLSYLRGQATGVLLELRDVDAKLYLNHLIEHVPSLYDSTALYPCEGIAVRPFQGDIAIPVPPPAFTAQAVQFDGADWFGGSGLLVPATSSGCASFWFKNNDASWTQSKTLFQTRVGSTTVMEAVTASNGRVTFRLNQDGTGSDTFTTATSTFVVNQWYHVLWAWDYATARFQIYVNGVALNTAAYLFIGSTKFDMAGANLTQFGLAATTAGSGIMTVQLGHVYIDTQASLDFSISANREKFALAGMPVDVGSNGSTPTGSQPAWYYNGAGDAFSNLGYGGSVPKTGTLTTASPAPSY